MMSARMIASYVVATELAAASATQPTQQPAAIEFCWLRPEPPDQRQDNNSAKSGCDPS
jgi:hypothetical protein